MYDDRITNTLNTTRICGGNHFQNAIEISDIVYVDKSPDSIIVTNGELIQDAVIATSLIHFPQNAPVLFSHRDYIDSDTVKQIFKLNPNGVNGVQIFLIGGISPDVGRYLMSLGFRIKIIAGKNYFETAAHVAGYEHNPENNIMIISAEDYREGLSACAYAAHMGVPILLTTKNRLPSYTRDVILETKDANVYLVGSEKTISEQVEKEIEGLDIKFIGRISGNDPYDVSVNFSKYKSPDGKFGWGKTDRNGHAFTFTAIENPFNSASGALLAHLGKHSPTLIIERNNLPTVTRDYIESVKPMPKEEPEPPFMHGWIIGCNDSITFQTQVEIEKALSIDSEHM
ncbi:MAG TPA: cell wall-binding repeat-containing protein [Lachnospiraceae bacterium]|nr:cell wall-binding repeat-containing protein [Lachnospiraceae bacterium]